VVEPRNSMVSNLCDRFVSLAPALRSGREAAFAHSSEWPRQSATHFNDTRVAHPARSADALVLENDERNPVDDLRLPFEAVNGRLKGHARSRDTAKSSLQEVHDDVWLALAHDAPCSVVEKRVPPQ